MSWPRHSPYKEIIILSIPSSTLYLPFSLLGHKNAIVNQDNYRQKSLLLVALYGTDWAADVQFTNFDPSLIAREVNSRSYPLADIPEF